MFLRRFIKNRNYLFFNWNLSKTLNSDSVIYARSSFSNVDVRSRICFSSISNLDDSKSVLRQSFDSQTQRNEFDIIEDAVEDPNYLISEFETKFCLKNILYSNLIEDDDILQKLNNCEDSNKIFEIFSNKKDVLQRHHLVQIVILLWSLNRNINGNQTNNFNNNVMTDIFEEFLDNLYQHIDTMNLDELTCCFLYLNKLGLNVSHNVMRQLLNNTLEKLSDFETDIPLTALSRLTVGVSSCQDFYIFLVCKDVIPHIFKHIEKCKSHENLRLITICLHHLHQMISRDILKIYKEKVSNLLDNGLIDENSKKCILRVINFLNFPHWSNENSKLVRRLAITLEKQDDKDITSKEVEIMFKLFQSHLEPAVFIPKLSRVSENLFNKKQTPELLACVVNFSKAGKRPEMIEMAKKIVTNPENYRCQDDFLPSNAIMSLFIILRSLKISDIKLCNTYWENTLKTILENDSEKVHFKLARHCHRYMHFNNNLGGTYRNRIFEREISKILVEEITNGISSVIPSKFARFSSFILAYGYRNVDESDHNLIMMPLAKQENNAILNMIVEKIEEVSNQFTIIDCLQISRGLQIAFEMRYRYFIPPELAQQFLRIENVLNNCAEVHLRQPNLNLTELNYIIRSLTNRRGSRKTSLYHKAIEMYRNTFDDINSRTIRDICFNLNSSGYLIPEINEQMLKYLVENKEHIVGDTVEKIVFCSYNLGYTPENFDSLHWASEIIKRDFEYMSGISIIQSCLALSYYKMLPEKLIDKIFNIEFIRRIEEEIQICYSKATYPERVLNQVMQLNRSVCLDYPESKVPWFQQNYIEAQMSKKTAVRTNFYSEIKHILTSVVLEEKFLKCNHITPYGYSIDFVIHLDKDKKPILPPEESHLVDRITKIAVLLLKLDSFCQNDNKTLRGHEYLKMRHLEMLGYKVIHINLNEWNSMYMNVPGAKVNYLRDLLQIE